MQSQKGYEIITDHRNGQRLAIHLSTGEVMRAVPVEVPEGTIFYTPEQQAEYRERKRIEDERRMKEAMLAMQNDALGYYYFATTYLDSFIDKHFGYEDDTLATSNASFNNNVQYICLLYNKHFYSFDSILEYHFIISLCSLNQFFLSPDHFCLKY